MWPLLIGAAAPGPADPPNEARTAVLLFIVLAALMAMLVLGVLLATISRRHRRSARKPAIPQESIDPWHEAGARIKTGD